MSLLSVLKSYIWGTVQCHGDMICDWTDGKHHLPESLNFLSGWNLHLQKWGIPANLAGAAVLTLGGAAILTKLFKKYGASTPADLVQKMALAYLGLEAMPYVDSIYKAIEAALDKSVNDEFDLFASKSKVIQGMTPDQIAKIKAQKHADKLAELPQTLTANKDEILAAAKAQAQQQAAPKQAGKAKDGVMAQAGGVEVIDLTKTMTEIFARATTQRMTAKI